MGWWCYFCDCMTTQLHPVPTLLLYFIDLDPGSHLQNSLWMLIFYSESVFRRIRQIRKTNSLTQKNNRSHTHTHTHANNSKLQKIRKKKKRCLEVGRKRRKVRKKDKTSLKRSAMCLMTDFSREECTYILLYYLIFLYGISSGYHNKITQTGWLKQQNIFSQFWSREV